jgi:hypothetical protein
MIVRDVDISPACCCLDCSIDGIVVICTSIQDDRADKYIAPDEADQYDQCILSCVQTEMTEDQVIDVHQICLPTAIPTVIAPNHPATFPALPFNTP